MGDVKIKKRIDLINQSTTPAAISLCNALDINVLRPPLLQKEGKLCLFHQINHPQTIIHELNFDIKIRLPLLILPVKPFSDSLT